MNNNTLFNKFETVTFNNKKTKDFIKGFDITNIESKGDFFMSYSIDGSPNLDTLSYIIYDDISYYWTIVLVNNIQDLFFDLPISQEELKALTKEQLTSEAEDLGYSSSEIDSYILNNYYDRFVKLETENDEKRKIRVVRPEMLAKFISLVESAV